MKISAITDITDINAELNGKPLFACPSLRAFMRSDLNVL
jgi:hypothetical protein